jgi:hypothetical protein
MRAGTAKRQTIAELRDLQRLAGAVIMRPLSKQWGLQKTWIDQRKMHEVASEFIKPNDRLSSFERIEIYNRQYWFRLIDCMYEDYPGLLAVLGRVKFNKLIREYLSLHPSRSFTLRNLGGKLLEFIDLHPELVAPRFDLARDMLRFEWAQVVAFDGLAKPPIAVDDLLGQDPAKLKLSVQPYLSLLDLQYPIDEFVMRLKQDMSRGEASNAMDEKSQSRQSRKKPVRMPRRQPVFVVVHRHDFSLYYKRLDPKAFAMLKEISRGVPLARAISKSRSMDLDAEQLGKWFANWAEIGWFCKRVQQ